MSSLGADTAWDYRRDNWWQHIQNDTLDVVYDTVGLSVDADYAMAKLRTGGIFVTIAGSTSTHPKVRHVAADVHGSALPC
jgi:NADPH:quinone reductase-like Zn-dependent oxidoreductase